MHFAFSVFLPWVCEFPGLSSFDSWPCQFSSFKLQLQPFAHAFAGEARRVVPVSVRQAKIEIRPERDTHQHGQGGW